MNLAPVPAKLPKTPALPADGCSKFTPFAAILQTEELRVGTRSHVIAWCKDLEVRALAGSSVRREDFFVGSKAPWFEVTDGLPQLEIWPGSRTGERKTSGEV